MQSVTRSPATASQNVVLSSSKSTSMSIFSNGCVSEESMILKSDDSADYQRALKDLGDLFRCSSEYIFNLEVQNSPKTTTVHHYDASSFDAAYSDIFHEQGALVSDDELETCGYMGWLEH